jgi:transposase-like protein
MKSAQSAAFRNYRQTTRDMGAAQVWPDLRQVIALSQVKTDLYRVASGDLMGNSSAVAQSLKDFQKAFPNEETCAEYLRKRRWPNGFVCPVCGSHRHDPLRSRRWFFQCRDCGRQTSITAGTLMHRTRLRLSLWFSAAYLTATYPESASALQFRELLGIP